MDEPQKRGFYSAQMAALTGTWWYSTPDGRKVEVTEVAVNPPRWDDVVDLGPVTDFRGYGKPRPNDRMQVPRRHA
jgi:hypothetical protein